MYTSTAAALTAENRRFLLGLKVQTSLARKTAIGLFHGSPGRP